MAEARDPEGVTNERSTDSELFSSLFGGAPTHVARAPGRVNLMGEHIDYCDLAVLPMATQHEAQLQFRARDDGLVRITNQDPEFDPVEFELGPAIAPGSRGDWRNYLQAPASELARQFAIWRGLDGVLSSDIPVAAGLSSSTALVNAVGLALAEANEVLLAPAQFAELMAEAEHYTGTRGGGMDQAIGFGARAGHAACIAFSPLRMRHVAVPEDWCFVVADTGVRAEKSGRAQGPYNQRRSECEEALDVVVQFALQHDRLPTRPRGYPDLLRMLGAAEVISLAEEALKARLLKRFRHVVTEADRVDQAVDCLLSADLAGFGTLMDASHGSLYADYQVSSRELDELVAIAREGGGAGARLTGAGFGGCIVTLADRGTVGAVLETLAEQYFEPRGMGDGIDDRLFVAVPSAGASVGIL